MKFKTLWIKTFHFKYFSGKSRSPFYRKGDKNHTTGTYHAVSLEMGLFFLKQTRPSRFQQVFTIVPRNLADKIYSQIKWSGK